MCLKRVSLISYHLSRFAIISDAHRRSLHEIISPTERKNYNGIGRRPENPVYSRGQTTGIEGGRTQFLTSAPLGRNLKRSQNRGKNAMSQAECLNSQFFGRCRTNYAIRFSEGKPPTYTQTSLTKHMYRLRLLNSFTRQGFF